MIVYRIGRTKHAHDLTGEGARLHGGRWNHIFIPCLYTSESRALAVLEYTVHVHMDDIPRALSFTTLEIPDKTIRHTEIPELPGNWKDIPTPSATKDFGTKLLSERKALVIKIPSAIIPREFNYLINPLHPDSRLIKIKNVEDFVYDIRIKTAT